ncbi:gamma-glutamylcyclotransferase family protein [Psychrobium sp. 1_MG-2023]|uniref:gamma-glutamylcyclotransferase family protein n=1 Tax=Psychrobium sp. 1_MG-2023 TaxID=3062624 RepID=UPI000C32DF2D|nr:gamma-glutamylcyclotransferase family protein [Psychrobium sp. 1_MG-2023]MDP2560016.1 gamma-glutamylcyclotransferase family protein [Psychrobium sp. 1_MG-2023]PKF56322.1 UDP-N-acetylmuramate--alanine ligase [Alteromonadales bacterium alter-6D02]
MEKLFSYGTLQMEHVQLETFGRKLNGTKDTLIGFILSEVRIKDADVIKTSGKQIHPILKFTGNEDDVITGTVFELTEAELQQADNYEVEEYKRIAGSFKSGKEAWAYVCATTKLPKKNETCNAN